MTSRSKKRPDRGLRPEQGASRSDSVRGNLISVPASLASKWFDEPLSSLPDFRVVTIGSRHKRLTRDKALQIGSDLHDDEEKSS